MNPAFSVIFFTAASGAGYGLLAWLGLFAATGLLPAGRAFATAALLLSFALVSGGLLSSTAHLGRPERAWRAVTQWRSSWLSREGVAALATYVPMALFAWALLFRRDGMATVAALGLLAALGSVVTLVCTAMIYRSLKPIQRWANSWVLPNYLALGLMTGALWLACLAALFGPAAAPLHLLAAALTLLAAGLKLGYWRFIDGSTAISTPESATGLGRFGKVRLFEPPHSEENFLLQEMGYRIARKHAAKLRRIALLLAFALPFVLSLAASFLPGLAGALLAFVAALAASAGVLVERWLFFAEARHTVTLYYGAATA